MTDEKDPGLPDMGEDVPAKTTPTKGQAVAAAPKTNPISRIRIAESFDEQLTIKGLITGPSGSGKTHFVASMPRCLMGLTEMQAVPSIRRANPKTAIFPIKTLGDLIDFQAIISSPRTHEKFDSIGLDSLTDVQRIIRDHYTSKQDKRNDVTDLESWGIVIDKTARVARVIRDVIGMHSWIVCLDAEEVVAGVGLVHRPAVTGKKLPNDLAQYVNIVGFLHKEETAGGMRRSIRFEGGERFLTKSMGSLAAVEPPVPSWILHRAGLGPEPSVEDMALVTAWQDLAKANN